MAVNLPKRVIFRVSDNEHTSLQMLAANSKYKTISKYMRAMVKEKIIDENRTKQS